MTDRTQEKESSLATGRAAGGLRSGERDNLDSRFPTAIEDYLQALLTASFRPFCLRFSKAYRLLDWWGEPMGYLDGNLARGMDVRETAPYLDNIDWQTQIVLPLVHTSDGRAAHVHLLPEADSCYVVYVQATQELVQRQELQQTANEVRLLNHEQRRLLSRLIEARTELESRRREAVEANRLKSRFIASMSHEFRTPLTSVVGYAALLSEELPAGHEGARHVAAIERASQHLLSLVDNILEQARLEDGGMVAHPSVFDLRRQVSDLAAMLAPLAAEKGLSFAAFVAPQVPDALVGDDMRLRQILLNLLGNAVKFTDHGSVQLDIDWQDGEFIATVTDSGPGISAENCERIFQAYERASEHESRVGAGLGLAITKRLAALLGGNVTVESTPGEGSRFQVVLPIPAALDDSAAPAIASPAPDAGVDSLLDRQSPRVLVAEDNEDIMMLVKMMLTRAGYDILLADNGEQAVQMALEEMPDVVLMDVNMPQMDGITATQELRESGFERPVIALTASKDAVHRRRALAAGCDDYVTKPIQIAELIAALERQIP